MKKGLMIIAAVGLLAAVSCKKDHTCTCTVTSTGSILGDFTVSADTVYSDMKKSDAEAACNTGDYSATALGITNTSECELN